MDFDLVCVPVDGLTAGIHHGLFRDDRLVQGEVEVIFRFGSIDKEIYGIVRLIDILRRNFPAAAGDDAFQRIPFIVVIRWHIDRDAEILILRQNRVRQGRFHDQIGCGSSLDYFRGNSRFPNEFLVREIEECKRSTIRICQGPDYGIPGTSRIDFPEFKLSHDCRERLSYHFS